MDYKTISQINFDLKKTKKAIISLGCSFVQGVGAIDENIYRNYEWEISPNSSTWYLTTEQKNKIIQDYPDVELRSDGISFRQHQFNNAFVNVLCKKYFNGEYTPINLGRTGNGNRATIKDLYFYPEISWDDMEEVIVIFCPSGLERMDFIDDTSFTINDHARWITAWPKIVDNNKGVRNKLWTGIKESLHSEKFETLEQIAHVQELLLWCKYKNAKLVIVPAFMQRAYTRERFLDNLSNKVYRDNVNGLIEIKFAREKVYDKSIERLVDMWPWQNMFFPDGAPSFADYSLQQEFGSWEKAEYFQTFAGKGSPDLWLAPCTHPTKKAHAAFAKILHKHITENL